MQYVPRANLPEKADEFLRGYLEAAEWCGIMEEQREAFELSVSPAWHLESYAEAEADCETFCEENAADLEDIDPARAGHYFYLTRNRHGAGFWDLGLGKAGERLTRAAHAYGEANVDFDAESETLRLI